jgi:hypothetical protein
VAESDIPYPVVRFLEQVASQSIMQLTALEAQRLLDWYGGLTNLEKAKQMIDEIGQLQKVKGHLKYAFKNDQLEGGEKAALMHPLYLAADSRIDELQGQLKELI